uniref:dolichyl-P-Glc:Man9GlcNAc2-PP-dolichol alpha-1,3-glucosyltransferase n=1 Tax=Chromera velia CCMP2878 TaxID=1169474 RepID=A0A0G4HEW9_9ALVE|eukprot:Cvel_26907.t1-p1 / transcript=Cvel_26907.t1 / gene=Cvel_26907 / organism=Chromera_velia_CCMP2878 / gene_product=Probable dolichyl pyrophosphate Man9GlcNAc2, putative / transcript_product=Probable dolichyl pyrophosphate Man9GlcNAc2, putative / location=Cvel_scaffold3271:4847-10431(-) / protein_length=973 / sequence_SO=supercontig / SO=protein_coding / is_pseudo=false
MDTDGAAAATRRKYSVEPLEKDSSSSARQTIFKQRILKDVKQLEKTVSEHQGVYLCADEFFDALHSGEVPPVCTLRLTFSKRSLSSLLGDELSDLSFSVACESDHYPFSAPLVSCLSEDWDLFYQSPEQLTKKILGEDWTPLITFSELFKRLLRLVAREVKQIHQTEEAVARVTASSRLLSSLEFAAKTKQKSTALLLIALVAIVLRSAVGLGPYSGEKDPPSFGDYEAQRHWLELTVNLPVTEWYVHTERNDLSWWGIDYPPLTAYHSWVLGKISAWIEPPSMELKESRGYETASHRAFMRGTVIVSDGIVFFTAALFWTLRVLPRLRVPWVDASSSLLLLLLSPPLVLVDHGHFQYNCVAVGLFLWAVALICDEKFLLGSAAFTLSLWYKQTMLYFAPPFFFFLLGLSAHPTSTLWPSLRSSVRGPGKGSGEIETRTRGGISPASLLPMLMRVLIIGTVVILTSLLVVGPLVIWADSRVIDGALREGVISLGSGGGHKLGRMPVEFGGEVSGGTGGEVPSQGKGLEKLLDLVGFRALVPVVRRIFPFGRGVYEDFVANFWVAVSPVFKANKIVRDESEQLIGEGGEGGKKGPLSTLLLTVSLGMTVVGFLPSCLDLAARPTAKRFLFSLWICSLSFFLFAWMVHEKAVLQLCMPALLLAPFLGGSCVVFVLAASLSLDHLAEKDGLQLQWVLLSLLWAAVALSCVPGARWGQGLKGPQHPSELRKVFKALSLSAAFFQRQANFVISAIGGEAFVSPANLAHALDEARSGGPQRDGGGGGGGGGESRRLFYPPGEPGPRSEEAGDGGASGVVGGRRMGEGRSKESLEIERLGILGETVRETWQECDFGVLWFVGALVPFSVVASVLLSLRAFVPPPLKLPYLWIYLENLFVFCIFLAYLVGLSLHQRSLPDVDHLTFAAGKSSSVSVLSGTQQNGSSQRSSKAEKEKDLGGPPAQIKLSAVSAKQSHSLKTS